MDNINKILKFTNKQVANNKSLNYKKFSQIWFKNVETIILVF
jgi:hypothetical protein